MNNLSLAEEVELRAHKKGWSSIPHDYISEAIAHMWDSEKPFKLGFFSKNKTLDDIYYCATELFKESSRDARKAPIPCPIEKKYTYEKEAKGLGSTVDLFQDGKFVCRLTFGDDDRWYIIKWGDEESTPTNRAILSWAQREFPWG